MSSRLDPATRDRLSEMNGGYDERAYAFVLAALEEVVEGLPQRRHVTGRELSDGCRDLALRLYGPLARTVLDHWSVRTTKDIGTIVFNLLEVGVLSKDGGIDNKTSQQRQYSSDLYYGSLTAFDAVNHKVLAKAVTEIEIRSGALATAGGVVFTALQDGWVVAYNDETLEELWRFNVGTPLKGAPVTYAIGPKQYLAVQAGGRHLHPVNWDKLQNSSYLFVFALN